MGELGLTSDAFWRMTFAELFFAGHSNRLRIERGWEQTRYLAALLINLNVKRSKQVTPEKLIPLSFDKSAVKPTKLSPEDVQKMIESWTANEVK